jgi:hypothetical protein
LTKNKNKDKNKNGSNNKRAADFYLWQPQKQIPEANQGKF